MEGFGWKDLAGRRSLAPTSGSFVSKVLGEERVVRKLHALPATWHVVHDVPGEPGVAGIEHIVIGPPGVFALTTQRLAHRKVRVATNAVYVDGHFVPVLAEARTCARRASSVLSAATGDEIVAQAVVVIVGADLQLPSRHGDVRVIDGDHLARWLRSLPVTLDPDGADALFELARRDVTWRVAARSPA